MPHHMGCKGGSRAPMAPDNDRAHPSSSIERTSVDSAESRTLPDGQRHSHSMVAGGLPLMS